MRTTAKLAQKRALLRSKHSGTTLTLEWTEWLNGAPVVDETTGATPETPGDLRTLVTKALIHSIRPTTSLRLYSEIQTGDKIIDLISPLVRITEPGNSGFTEGQVVDTFALKAANRTVAEPFAALAETVDLRTLKGLCAIINDERWVQQQIGQDLAQCWDAIFHNIKISQSLLFRRSA